VFHDELIGVITLYSSEQIAFDDQHQSAIDGALIKSHRSSSAPQFDRDHGRDAFGAPQNLEQLEQFVVSPKPPEIRRAFPLLVTVHRPDSVAYGSALSSSICLPSIG
jgi:hypothetical protein